MGIALLFAAINWWAVVLCVAFSIVNGFIWYSPKTFFGPWWKIVGKTEKPRSDNMGIVFGFTFLAAAVQAVLISLAVTAMSLLLGGATIEIGILTGAALWVGLIAPTYLSNKLFAGHGFKAWAIEVGNHLINFLAFGALFGVWR